MMRGCPAGVSVPQAAQIELFAFAWFISCWIGYTLYSDRAAGKARGLVGAMERQREHWMRQMVARGETPFLHSYADNAGAIGLYESLGFRIRRQVHVLVIAK